MKANNKKKEYSKTWINKWQYFVMFWLSVFYVVDIVLNQGMHLETLSITLVTSIVAVIIPYLVKSYFGKKQEEEIRLREMQNYQNEENMEDV